MVVLIATLFRISVAENALTCHAGRPSHTAPSSLMFLGLLVVDQHLAVLAISMRFFLGHPHHIEHTRRVVEDGVHFFERPICRFGIEEIYHGYNECVAGG